MYVKTQSLDEGLKQIIDSSKFNPTVSLLVGERGIGKSTALWYCTHLCEKERIFPLYISIQIEAPPANLSLEIAKHLLRSLGQRILVDFHSKRSDIFEDRKRTLVQLAKYLGLSYDDNEGFILDPTMYLSTNIDHLQAIVNEIMRILSSAGLASLIAVDNLDKLEQNHFIAFLKGAFAQTIFESLMHSGCSIVIAATPALAQRVGVDRDLNYLSSVIVIDPLSPRQAEELIAKRIRNFAKTSEVRNPFKQEVVHRVCHDKKGVTRDILIEASNLCKRSYALNFKEIGLELFSKDTQLVSQTKTYYDFIEVPAYKRGAELILRASTRLEQVQLDELASALISAWDRSKTESSEDIALILLSERLTVQEEQKDQLNDDVRSLFDVVSKSGWDLRDFLKWLLSPEALELAIPVGPGYRIKRTITGIYQSLIKPPKKYKNLIVAGIENTFTTDDYFGDVNQGLPRSMSSLDSLLSANWEATSPDVIFETIYSSLMNYLFSFAKYYAICSNRTMHVPPGGDKVFSFVENAIKSCQEDMGITLESYRLIHILRNNRKSLRKGKYIPRQDELVQALNDLDAIVTESRKMWSYLNGLMKPIEDEKKKQAKIIHEGIRSKIVQLATRMGFTIIREDKRNFKVNGEEYFDLGCFGDPSTNTAEVDVVHVKKVGSKDGLFRDEYFVAEVKCGDRLTRAQEIICFLKKCKDLMFIIESDLANYPQFVKPIYSLYFVALGGFEKGSTGALKQIRLPERATVELINREELNNRLRNHNLEQLD